VIAVKKPPKKGPPQPVLDPHSLIAGSPVIGTPALGQVHNLGPPPHDLVAVTVRAEADEREAAIRAEYEGRVYLTPEQLQAKSTRR
jgi:hypothetical protein